VDEVAVCILAMAAHARENEAPSQDVGTSFAHLHLTDAMTTHVAWHGAGR
jgi:hypothetical protein